MSQIQNRRHIDPDDIKAQREAGWIDFHPEDFCHCCGNRNISGGGWWVDSDRWNLAVAGLDRGKAEILCPSCFVDLWQEATGLRASWHLVPQGLRAR